MAFKWISEAYPQTTFLKSGLQWAKNGKFPFRMIRKHRYLWIALFVSAALLIGGLATGWNILIFRDYSTILSLSKHLPVLSLETRDHSTALIVKMSLGNLGFLLVLVFTLALFIKLWNEMRLNQLQSEFLAAVTHELKTPLATLDLASSLIRSGSLPSEETERLWQSHDAELNRLREQVETLLDAAHWQSKPPKKKMTPFNLENWLNDQSEEWALRLGTQGKLERKGDPLDFEISTSSQTLKLITDNLMSNAKKFSKGNPHITLRTKWIEEPFRKRWQIAFEDHGWGFDPAHSKKIFYRFFRSQNQAPYAIPGTGLGLFLAKTASKSIGISLQAESQGQGLGARFILEGVLEKSKKDNLPLSQ